MVCSLLTKWGTPSIVSNVAIAGYHAPHVAPRKALCLKFPGSLLNPIIYWIMNPQFKEAFKKALRCCCYGNHDADHNHARDVAEVLYTFLLSVVILNFVSEFFLCPTLVTGRSCKFRLEKTTFSFSLPSSKLTISLISIYKHYAIDIADPSSLQTRVI